MDPLLELKDIKKYFSVQTGFFGRQFKTAKVVDGVSFKIGESKTLGLVGESGCGKTTLARLILALFKPTEGEILFNRARLDRILATDYLKKCFRKDVQAIFQDPISALNPRQRIKNIIKEPFIVHEGSFGRDINKRIIELLGTVGLNEKFLRKFPHELSGGESQRVNIARALALKPKLIICDEPLSSLDISLQARLINLFLDLQRDFNISYLFISHDLRVIERISDDVAVMYLGKICEYAPWRDLYNQPLHPYTKVLMSSLVKGKRLLAKGEIPSPTEPPPGCNFHTRCPFVMDKCKVIVPQLLPHNGHLVSCHLY